MHVGPHMTSILQYGRLCKKNASPEKSYWLEVILLYVYSSLRLEHGRVATDMFIELFWVTPQTVILIIRPKLTLKLCKCPYCMPEHIWLPVCNKGVCSTQKCLSWKSSFLQTRPTCMQVSNCSYKVYTSCFRVLAIIISHTVRLFIRKNKLKISSAKLRTFCPGGIWVLRRYIYHSSQMDNVE